MIDFASHPLHGDHVNAGVVESPVQFGPDRTETMKRNGHDPARLDELMRRGAVATQRDAPGPGKRLARQLEITERSANRYKQGDPYSPGVKLLAYVDALARGDHTTAAATLAEAYAVYIEAMQDRPTPELEARLRDRTRARIDRQAALDHALAEEIAAFERWDLAGGEVDDARIALAEVDVEISAIRRTLRDRARRADR